MKRRKMSAYKKAQIKKKAKIFEKIFDCVLIFALLMLLLWFMIEFIYALITEDFYAIIQWGITTCIYTSSIVFVIVIWVGFSIVSKDFKGKDNKGDDDDDGK